MQNLRESFAGIVDRFWTDVGDFLPNLAAALLILIGGWLLALVISRLVRGMLNRTTLDNRIAGWVRGEDKPVPDIERTIGKAVFWFLMLFVLIAFFAALKLTVVTQPLNSLATKILAAFPSIISATLLLLLAWAVASAVRLLVQKVLDGFGLDERLGSEVRDEDSRVPISKTLSETAYWLIFLLFLPAILGQLQLEGLLTPIEEMVSELVGFLPNLFAGLVIFLVGWFIARILQRVVSNLLAAAGVDSVGERVGVTKALGKQKLSGLIGLIVYVLVLLPVLISALGALKLEAVTEPASEMLNRILAALPSIFGALVILAVFYVVGRIVSDLASNLLAAAGFNKLLGWIGLKWESKEGDGRPSDFVGHLAFVIVMLLASVVALNMLQFSQLADLVSSFIVFLGNVLLGVVIFALGLYLSNLAARAIRASGGSQSGILATAARVAIIVLAGAMALRQMNVAEDIINIAFGLVLGAAAVAAAVAFGIGGRDLARQELERWSHSLRSGSSRDEQRYE